ncbi:MAG: glycosyltransferase [Pseudomonadota bacterium]
MIGDLPIDFDKIRIRGKTGPHLAQKADYIRLRLLERYGGLWVDMDAIALHDLAAYANAKLGDAEFLCMRKAQGHVSNNFMAAKPGSAIIREAVDEVTKVLVNAAATGEELDWKAVGAAVVTPLMEKHASTANLLPESDIHPIDWKESDLFFKRSDLLNYRDYVNDDAKVVMLYNARFRPIDRTMPRRELLNDNSLIGQLFRVAMNDDDVSPKDTSTTQTNVGFSAADVDMIFTTINRIEAATTFIKSVRDQIGPDIRITIAVQDQDRDAWENRAKRYDLKLIFMEPDAGISRSRNACLCATNRPILFLVDDDFIFDENLHFKKALKILDTHPKIEILGGMFLNQNRKEDGSLTEPVATAFTLRLHDSEEIATFIPVEYTARQRHFVNERHFFEYADTVNNFALMRRRLFDDHGLRWNSEIKILGEHEEFYIKLKRLCIDEEAVAYTNLLVTRHVRESNSQFAKVRERTGGLLTAMKSTGHQCYQFIGRRTDILCSDGHIFRMKYPSWKQ